MGPDGRVWTDPGPGGRLPVPDGTVLRSHCQGWHVGLDRPAAVDGSTALPGRLGHGAPGRRAAYRHAVWLGTRRAFLRAVGVLHRPADLELGGPARGGARALVDPAADNSRPGSLAAARGGALGSCGAGYGGRERRLHARRTAVARAVHPDAQTLACPQLAVGLVAAGRRARLRLVGRAARCSRGAGGSTSFASPRPAPPRSPRRRRSRSYARPATGSPTCISGHAWLPAGWSLATAPLAILASAAVAAAGLAGLASRRLPERRFLVGSFAIGVVCVGAGYAGPAAGVAGPAIQSLLSGPLGALRNTYKFEPVVTLPLALGLTHLVARLGVAFAPPRARSARPARGEPGGSRGAHSRRPDRRDALRPGQPCDRWPVSLGPELLVSARRLPACPRRQDTRAASPFLGVRRIPMGPSAGRAARSAGAQSVGREEPDPARRPGEHSACSTRSRRRSSTVTPRRTSDGRWLARGSPTSWRAMISTGSAAALPRPRRWTKRYWKADCCRSRALVPACRAIKASPRWRCQQHASVRPRSRFTWFPRARRRSQATPRPIPSCSTGARSRSCSWPAPRGFIAGRGPRLRPTLRATVAGRCLGGVRCLPTGRAGLRPGGIQLLLHPGRGRTGSRTEGPRAESDTACARRPAGGGSLRPRGRERDGLLLRLVAPAAARAHPQQRLRRRPGDGLGGR